MKMRIGKGTVGLYLAISALVPLAIYLLLSLQAQANHERQRSAAEDQALEVQLESGGLVSGPLRPSETATPSARPAGAWGDGKTSAGPPVPDDVNPPARGAPYNWTFMAYSAVLMLLVLMFVLWLIRRNTRARNAET